MGNIKRKGFMQVIFYCVILFSLYFGLNWSGEAVEKPFIELEKILEVMDKHEIELTDWTLYAREHLNSWTMNGEFNDELDLLKGQATDFQWEPLFHDERKDQTKAVATFTHHELGVIETLTYIIYPHNKQLHSYLIYEVHGTKKLSEDQWQFLSSKLDSRLKSLFKENTNIFTCATGIGSDKLSSDLNEQAGSLLAEFSAQPIEFLKEETFISISAYTKAWNNAISTNSQKMNLQVALRTEERLGGKTTVTIGTPIITTEY